MKTFKTILFSFLISGLFSIGVLSAKGDEMPSDAMSRVQYIGHYLTGLSETLRDTNDFKDIEKNLENIEVAPDNAAWRTITHDVDRLYEEITNGLNHESTLPKTFKWDPDVKKKFITLDTPITWKDYSGKEKTWKLGEIKKLTEDVIVTAVKNVGKNYCYVFTAYMHEKGENDYFLLNKPVTSCKTKGIDGEDIDCGQGGSEHNTNNLYSPVRIDCSAMPKENKFGKAFLALDPYFQKDTWRQNMCFELSGGITEATADTLKPVKLNKGEFMGRSEFKMLELKCYHKGVHTSKTGEEK